MFYWIFATSKRPGRTATLPIAAASLLLAAHAVAPARAQQTQARASLTGAGACARESCLALPPPADTGKAVIDDLLRHGGDDCAAALPCRLRLIGVVPGRGGAIELRGTALKW